jgi:hypothetical protein
VGAAALAVVIPDLAAPALALGAIGATALAMSASGRRPVAGTTFCLCLVALLLLRADHSVWLAAAVAPMLGVYLLTMDIAESTPRRHASRRWRAQQHVALAAVVVGPAILVAAAAVPLGAAAVSARVGVAIVIVAAGAATTLLWWARASDTR